MGAETKIQWCDHTFNSWIGCAKVSEACKHCYAEVSTPARRSKARGLPLWGETAARLVTSDEYWRQPERWNRAAERDGVRRRVFCASLADVFEDHPALPPIRARLFELIGRTRHLDWLLLTKRPEWIRASIPWGNRWPHNVWIGTTVETQARADERLPILVKLPARVRFVSVEPQLGPINLTPWFSSATCAVCGSTEKFQTLVWHGDHHRCPRCDSAAIIEHEGIDWVIVGGESGPGARPFGIQWARNILRQCRDAHVPVFVKQLGRSPIDSRLVNDYSRGLDEIGVTTETRVVTLRDPKGGDIEEWTGELDDLRVRESPEVRP
jgi:protein gp37